MKIVATALALLIACSASADVYQFGGPRTTNNDDSCDIALLPAATLLLPYFEVDLAENRGGETTLFSITNVTNAEQIAHVTLWTDRAYPVITFDIYLTGYDVQSINLYDVIKLGQIAPSRGTGSGISPAGVFSVQNGTLDLSACEQLPGAMAPEAVTRMQQALVIGRISGCNNVGEVHSNAIGYATIDVVGACNSQLSPADSAYYDGTLRHDNVLIGDYIQVQGANGFAQGAPMVHVRAIPEGGTRPTNLPRTFYGRFLPDAKRGADARQPLPSRFAARWIDGGRGQFETTMKVWREGTPGANAPCSAYRDHLKEFVEAVTFDEEENAWGYPPRQCPITCIELDEGLPATGRHDMSDVFPRNTIDALGGWLYLNLADEDGNPRQAWVVTSMRAEGRYSADVEAAALGNGCSPGVEESEISTPHGVVVIGPSGNVNP